MAPTFETYTFLNQPNQRVIWQRKHNTRLLVTPLGLETNKEFEVDRAEAWQTIET